MKPGGPHATRSPDRPHPPGHGGGDGGGPRAAAAVRRRDVRLLPPTRISVAAGGQERDDLRGRAAPAAAADSSDARRRRPSSSRASTSTAASASARPTCSRRSGTRCPAPKYFGTFIEYTALVGALGYQQTVELLRGAKLICIDEFELDDPGDTMLMTRLLGELVPTGTRVAATSNTPPNSLGEGRFAAEDFLREIQAMSANFETMRIDGSTTAARGSTGTPMVARRDAADEASSRGPASAAARVGRCLRSPDRPSGHRAPVEVHQDDRRPRRDRTA